MQFRDESDKGTTLYIINFCANPEKKKRNGDPGNDYSSVRGRKLKPPTEIPNSPRQKEARQVKSKVKSMVVIFF
jgi:hypothetical protein